MEIMYLNLHSGYLKSRKAQIPGARYPMGLEICNQSYDFSTFAIHFYKRSGCQPTKKKSSLTGY